MFELTSRLLELDDVSLAADLRLPPDTNSLVVFVHGSGSGRSSPRNQYVAESLARRGLASLLFDLLTESEQRRDNLTRQIRFNIGLLARRLVKVIDLVGQDAELQSLRLGLFGASTGAAAALLAAAERADVVHAVVSRGGRTDLAGPALSQVKAPTLQIVGALDPVVVRLNRQSSHALRCIQRLDIVPGATHLFEEPGTLELVARLAADWFETHLGGTFK